MYYHGHLGMNLIVTAPVFRYLVDVSYAGALQAPGEVTLAVYGFVLITAVSSLPDKDMKVPFLAHRGFSHSVFAAVIVGALSGALLAALATISPLMAPTEAGLYGAVFVTLGFLGHIAADMLTPMGIRPLTPLSNWRCSLDLWQAKNWPANTGMFVVGVVMMGAIFKIPLPF